MKKLLVLLSAVFLLVGFYSCKRDLESPTVTISSEVESGSTIETKSVDITIEFSELVLGFTAESITCQNATVSDFAGQGFIFTAKLTAINEGKITAQILEGAVTDEAGNPNIASEIYSFTWGVDKTKPNVEITSSFSKNQVTNSSLIDFKIKFSKDVTGFTQEHIKVTNGTLKNFAGKGTTYTVNLVPKADGQVSIQVPANKVADSNGNKNTASNTFSIVSDRTGPIPTLSSFVADGTFTNVQEFTINITFNEVPVGFELEDLIVTNGVILEFEGSELAYSAKISAIEEDEVTIQIDAGAAEDSLGNPSLESIPYPYTVKYNTKFAYPIISSLEVENGKFTNSAPIPFSIVFSKDVTNFTTDHINVDNATLEDFVAVSDDTYTVNAVPIDEGEIFLFIEAGVCADIENGLDNLESNLFIFTYDITKPSAEIDSLVGEITNSSPLVFSLEFSEEVDAPSAGDFTVVNGTIIEIAGAGTSYTVAVNPTTLVGDIALTLEANSVQDLAGNFNEESNTKIVTFDELPPYVDISATTASVTDGGYTDVAVHNFTFTFSEDVEGFTASDITLTNASVSNFIGSGAVYTADITASDEAVIVVGVNAAVVKDGAGNDNEAAVPFSYTYDITPPEVIISSSDVNQGGISNLAALTFDINFSEPVIGFDITEIIVTNASLSNFSGSDAAYQVTLIPNTDGEVTVFIDANVCSDKVGLPNNASELFTFTSNQTAPGVVLSSPDVNHNAYTTSDTFTIDIDFDKLPVSFDQTDIVVTNGSAAPLTGSDLHYSVVVTAASEGAVTISIPAGAFEDEFGNSSAQSNTYIVNYTTDVPVPTISSLSVANGGLTNLTSIPFTITFTKAVTGFDAGDITVSNATLENFAGSGDAYTVNVIPSADGEVALSIAAGVCIDARLLENIESNEYSFEVETVRPTAIIDSALAITNSSPITFTLDFSEPVSAPVAGDFTVVNGTINTITGTGDSYTVTVNSAISEGNISLTLKADSVKDAAGNFNLESNTKVVAYDEVGPTLAITSTVLNNAFTNTETLAFTFTFSEDVTGFTASDIATTNASVSNFAGSGAVYTADITAIDESLIIVGISAGVAQDKAGNDNQAAAPFSYTYDKTQPEVSITSLDIAQGDTTNLASLEFNLDFSEIVTAFDITDLTVTNASLSAFSGSNAAYKVTLTPIADGEVSLSLAAGICADRAGNLNKASTLFTFTSNRTAPKAILSSTDVNEKACTTSESFYVNIDFDKLPVGFEHADIIITNGSAATLTGSGLGYSVLVTADAEGLVTMYIPAGAFEDEHGNASEESNTFIVNYTTAVPTPTISSLSVADGGLTNLTNIPFKITFCQEVNGFDISGITTTNASLENFAGSGNTYTVNVKPSADGEVKLSIPAGVAQSVETALENKASEEYSFDVDTVKPTAVIDAALAITNSSPITFSLDFSEPVSAPVANNFTVVNGTINAISGSGDSYTVTVDSTTSAGNVALTLKADSVKDAAGNFNLASNTKVVEFDGVGPTVIITSTITNGSYTNVDTHTFTFTFSEDVTGFTASDIALSNASTTNFTGSGNLYNVSIVAQGQGAVTVAIPAAVAQDLAGNDNIESSAYGFIYDSIAPVATISSETADGDYITTSPILFEIEFDELVTGFELNDIIVTAGTLADFTEITAGLKYSVNVTPTTPEGDVTLAVKVAAVRDLANNPNLATLPYTVKYDSVQPTPPLEVKITSGDITAANVTQFSFEVIDGDPHIAYTYIITSNGGGDPVVGGGNLDANGNITKDNVDLTQLLDGTVTLTVAVVKPSGLNETKTDTCNLDANYPTVRYNYPTTGATAVPIFTPVFITFSEIVEIQNPNGTISLKRYSNNSLVEEIKVSDSKVTGTGTTTVKVEFSSLFDYNTRYYIEVSNNAFRDVANNGFAGISNKNVMNFTTVPNQGTRVIENPSFEISTQYPSIDKYGDGWYFVESQNATVPEIAGWYTDHPPSTADTKAGYKESPIEMWDGSVLGGGVRAYDGDYFVELNAEIKARLYQYVLLINNAEISYEYHHRKRGTSAQGGGPHETIHLSIYSADGATELVEIDTYTNTNRNAWTKRSGSWVSQLPTGLYQFSFYTSDDGSNGNFLDGITISLNPLVEFATTSMAIAEGAKQNPCLSINGTVTQASTVTVEIIEGSAVENVDFIPGNLTIPVPPGAYSLANPIEIPLGIVDNNIYEPAKTIELKIAGVTGDLDAADANGVDGFAGTMIYTILNDD